MIKSKGYAAMTAGAELQPWEFERRDLAPTDVLIEILYCGVCHSDLHQVRNDWFPGIFPMVPGHEIVGRIVQTGSQANKFKVGDLAGVGVMVDACHECENCRNHQEQFCMVSPVQTYNGLGRDKKPTFGGYSTNIVVPEAFAHRVSEKLNPAAVAPLLCAGITTWSPLRRWKVGKDHKVAVVGLGGLGHMAVKFAVALGAEVTILSTSASKKRDAESLGAHHFVITTDADQLNTARHAFDFIVDTVSANHDLNTYLSLLKTNGTIICVGAPEKPHEVPVFSLLGGNKTIAGSGAGGLDETQEMLDFCAEKGIVSDIEMIAIQDIQKAFDRMEKGDVRYRFVIDMASLKES